MIDINQESYTIIRYRAIHDDGTLGPYFDSPKEALRHEIEYRLEQLFDEHTIYGEIDSVELPRVILTNAAELRDLLDQFLTTEETS